MSKNITIMIEGVSVPSDGADDVLAVAQVVGSALKNNGVFSVDRISVDVEPEVSDIVIA